MINKLSDLYVVTTEIPELDRSHSDVAEAALKGGAKIIQYREKNKSAECLVKQAMQIKNLCREYRGIFIVNDHPELAKEVDADGLHLGQNDQDIVKARIMFPEKIIGLSATNLAEAIQAQSLGANYIGAGPIFETPTKTDAAPPFGLEVLSQIAKAVSVPIVAIGGINMSNAAATLAAGADALAVISAIANEKDMVRAAQQFSGVTDESVAAS